MMKKSVRSSTASVTRAACFGLESLEARQMMASHTRQPAVVTPALLPPTTTWVPYAHIVQQDLAAANFPWLTGAGIGVAIIDRGIDYNHPQLGAGKIIAGYNFRDNNTNTLDDYGHGTGVAGIIAANGFNLGGYDQGVAPQAGLVSLKQESSYQIKSALDWVIANHATYNIQVVNLTDFITDVLPGAENANIYLPELKTIHDLGIVIDSPVGNGDYIYGDVPINNPSLSPYVNGIGGIDLSDSFYVDSRRGDGLELLAPASNVTMPYYLRNKNSVGYDQFDDNYDGAPTLANYALGTSWASAYTSGAATLLKQIDPTISPDQLIANLKNSGDPVLDPMHNVYYPRLNIEKAIELTYKTQDDVNQGNTTFATAAGIRFRRGSAAFSNAKLLIGKPDNYTFTLGSATTLYFNTPYTGPSARPTAQVFNYRGQLIGNFTSGELKLSLGAGQIYVKISSPDTLIGTYGLSVTTTSQAGVAPAASTFSSTPIVSTTGGTSSLLTDKNTPVFA